MVGRSASPARSSSRSSRAPPKPPTAPVAPAVPAAPSTFAPTQTTPGFGTLIKEGIGHGIGTSVGMRIAGLFGFGPQVTVKHETNTSAEPLSTGAPTANTSMTPQTTTTPYWYPEYKECLQKGEDKEICIERWIPEAEKKIFHSSS